MDIVLIPGALATAKFWHNQERYFQEKTNIHHVSLNLNPSITHIAQQIAPTLPNEFILIGFSYGGYIALELMRHIPKQIKKLILINSGARPISEKGLLERERSLALINQGKFDLLINLIFKNSIHDKNKYRELQPMLKTMAQKIGAEQYTLQLQNILNKPDHSDLLETIQCPTLLITSQEDNIVPIERSEHMAEHIKNSKLVYIKDCGHLAPLEQPDILNGILSDWL